MKIKNPYTIFNGDLLDINNIKIESGYNENYLCPDDNCEEALTARKGNKRINHFSHKSNEKCNGLESALHKKAKEIIGNLDQLYIPDYRVSPYTVFKKFNAEILNIEKKYKYSLYTEKFFSDLYYSCFDWDEFKLISSLNLQLDKYKIESEVLLNGLKPDIKLTNKVTGDILYIEIAVTSFISEEKKVLIKENGLSVIEINLSKYYRSEQYSTEKTQDLEFFLKKIFKKDWTYKTEGYQKFSDAKFNWINLKNENKLIENRKNQFVKSFQKRLSIIYEFYNNDFIPFLNNQHIEIKYLSNKELLKEFENSASFNTDILLTENLVGHFRKMYMVSDLYKKKRVQKENKESLHDFIKRMS